jgi:hypothetical protein
MDETWTILTVATAASVAGCVCAICTIERIFAAIGREEKADPLLDESVER